MEEKAMGDTSVSYKCPSCGAPLAYQPGKGDKITCEYCETEFTVEALDKLYAHSREMADAAAKAQEKKAESQPANEWEFNEALDLKTMNCPSCGAEILCDENTMATQCCYCGNPALVPGRFSGGLKPDFVIPFAKTKEDAIASMKEFYKGKWLLPSNYAAESRLEKIQGMYVPFWLFDSSVNGYAEFKTTTSRTWDDGDNTIIETDHFRCIRQGTMDFHRVPVDGSERMDDTYMQSIEPYDYKDLTEFTTTYLAGYLADKYDVDSETAQQIADSRVETTTAEKLENTVTGYETVHLDSCQVIKEDGSIAYAMAPVWILSSKYNGKTYTFMMNGQTGNIVGSLPVDKKKGLLYGGIFALLTLPVTYYIGTFLWAILGSLFE